MILHLYQYINTDDIIVKNGLVNGKAKSKNSFIRKGSLSYFILNDC